MTNDIGNIIISKINSLEWLDKYAGVVKPIVLSIEGTRKTFPASCQTSFEDCSTGRYMDLVPDSSKKSVLYLEDSPLRPVSRQGQRTNWRTTFNLVCWLNLPKLGQSGCSYSGAAIHAIIKSFPVTPFNYNDKYHQVLITMSEQQSKSVNPFAKYNYDEAVNQFLMYPYDHFMLSLDVEFSTDQRCFEIPELNQEVNCP